MSIYNIKNQARNYQIGKNINIYKFECKLTLVICIPGSNLLTWSKI